MNTDEHGRVSEILCVGHNMEEPLCPDLVVRPWYEKHH